MNEVDKLIVLELARNTIEAGLEGKEVNKEQAKHLNQNCSVFVTLKKHRNLRGGIGILSEKPLYKAVIEAAREAAFNDPRFSKLQSSELRALKIEISVIGDIKQIKAKDPEDYVEDIKIGKTGLLLKGAGRALLLPQVAVENGYTALQFLNALAQAAGLSFKAWRDFNNKVYKFQATTFKE